MIVRAGRAGRGESAVEGTRGADGGHPSRGRPRDPDVDRAILSTTLDLLTHEGYAQLTMDLVAARAGVGKASLYRRWPNKVALVAEAVANQVRELPGIPDTGSLRADMLAYLRAVVLQRQFVAPVMAAVAGEVSTNGELREALRRSVVQAQTGNLAAIVQRAVDRGQLPGSTDVRLLAVLPLALVHQAAMFLGHRPDEALLKRIVDQFFSEPDARKTAERAPSS